MGAVVTIAELLKNPRASAEYLASDDGPPYISGAIVRKATKQATVIELTTVPFHPMSDFGYPDETYWLVVTPTSAIAAPLPDDPRRWEHRYGGGLGEFCLWYPDDPPTLKWSIDEPVEELLAIVSVHVQAEEYNRRAGRWPIPDAPHGYRGPLPLDATTIVRRSHQETT